MADVIAFDPLRKKEEGDKEKPSDLEKTMAQNKKNAERIAKERSEANKVVLRSYRIKN